MARILDAGIQTLTDEPTAWGYRLVFGEPGSGESALSPSRRYPPTVISNPIFLATTAVALFCTCSFMNSSTHLEIFVAVLQLKLPIDVRITPQMIYTLLPTPADTVQDDTSGEREQRAAIP